LARTPVTLREANEFVARHHRHRPPPQGHRFCTGVGTTDGRLVGVVVVGRPVARFLDDGHTAQVSRLATDGTPNACSALLGAAWLAARALGYRRLITYTRADESGASLRAAGYRPVAHLPARSGWDCPSRARNTAPVERAPRIRWEIGQHTPHLATVGQSEQRVKTP
jgi:hypothetical protein